MGNHRIACIAAMMIPVGTLLYGCLGGSGGGNNSFIVDDTGFAWGCGFNDYGQIGDGTTTSQSFMSRVFGGLRVTSMAGGRHHSLTMKGDGSVWSWGRNSDGELGNGTTTRQVTPIRVSGF